MSSDRTTAQSSVTSTGPRAKSRVQTERLQHTVVSTGSPAGAASARRKVWFYAIAVAASVAAIGVATWFFVLRDRYVPKRFGVVVPGEIYRSGQISRRLIAGVIDRYHIGTIIDLNGFDPSDVDQQAELNAARSKGVRHFRFPLRGNGTGQIERYADAVETLARSQRSGVPVLVHCYAGTQRTGGCLSFYRLLIRNDPPERVYEDLGRYGWDAGTDQVLLDYINTHMRAMAELLVQRHVLDRVPGQFPRLHP